MTRVVPLTDNEQVGVAPPRHPHNTGFGQCGVMGPGSGPFFERNWLAALIALAQGLSSAHAPA